MFSSTLQFGEDAPDIPLTPDDLKAAVRGLKQLPNWGEVVGALCHFNDKLVSSSAVIARFPEAVQAAVRGDAVQLSSAILGYASTFESYAAFKGWPSSRTVGRG
ncbi:hypothetical protein HY374_00090 [Candidatus Berkelbacteria bacterium]|nr:hypothetical protein [Candidatus Berkelbacteria bacterium]